MTGLENMLSGQSMDCSGLVHNDFTLFIEKGAFSILVRGQSADWGQSTESNGLGGGL